MRVVVETSFGTVLDTIEYFLAPSEIIQKVSLLHDIQRLTGNARRFTGYSSVNEQVWWVTGERYTVALTETADGYKLELFTFEFDEVNAVDIEPEFILSRGKDDSTWTMESNYVPVDQDWEAEFKRMTDIFYMGEAKLYESIFDFVFYHGGEVPDDFSYENVASIVSSHELEN